VGVVRVTKFVILYPLIFRIVNDRPFKFYAELRVEEYNKNFNEDRLILPAARM